MFWKTVLLAPQDERSAPPVWVKAVNVGLALGFLSLTFFLCITFLHYDWNFSSIWERRAKLLSGWLLTVGISLITLATSTLFGFILALSQRQFFLPLRYFSKTVVETIRASPLIVVIFLVWYGFGGVFRWPDSYRFAAGIGILTLYEGAYISEIIRAGIESISQTQLEAARAVGFTSVQTYRYVILPQAIRQILPPLTGQLVSLVKDTSLLYVISIEEFTQMAKQVESETYSSLESYLPLAVGYLLLTLPISLLSRSLERHFKYET